MEKPFVIKCKNCAWTEKSTGISSDLAHLNEIKSNCPTCGKRRRFKCAKCGNTAEMYRIKGNS